MGNRLWNNDAVEKKTSHKRKKTHNNKLNPIACNPCWPCCFVDTKNTWTSLPSLN